MKRFKQTLAVLVISVVSLTGCNDSKPFTYFSLGQSLPAQLDKEKVYVKEICEGKNLYTLTIEGNSMRRRVLEENSEACNNVELEEDYGDSADPSAGRDTIDDGLVPEFSYPTDPRTGIKHYEYGNVGATGETPEWIDMKIKRGKIRGSYLAAIRALRGQVKYNRLNKQAKAYYYSLQGDRRIADILMKQHEATGDTMIPMDLVTKVVNANLKTYRKWDKNKRNTYRFRLNEMRRINGYAKEMFGKDNVKLIPIDKAYNLFAQTGELDTEVIGFAIPGI